MTEPFPSRPGYRDTEPNDSSDWVALGLEGLAASREEPVPFRLIAKRFKSSSTDSERFIHDPLQVLAEQPLFREEGVDLTWRVTTFVVNHHQTLSRIYMFAMAVVSGTEKTVSVTIYKEGSGD